MNIHQKIWALSGVILLAAFGSAVPARPGDCPGRMPGGVGGRGGIGAGAIERLVNNEKAIARLGLSADQVAALKARLADAEKTLIKLRAEVELAEAEVRSLMRKDPVDRAAVMRAVDAAGAAYVALRKAMIEERLALREIVGPEASKKARRFLAQRRAGDEDGARGRIDRRERRGPPPFEPEDE
jgi:Spy/CpxP family protein refolding chaperone